MANPDRPNGYRPAGEVLRSRDYVAQAAVYPGDLVKMNAAGTVEQAGTADACIGVALTYAAAAADTVKVADHPDQLFIGQADGADINVQTDILLNYQNLNTSANTTYKVSRMEVDSSTGATNSNYPLKLIDIDTRADNALGAQVDVIVKINNHQLAGGTGTVGV